MKSSFRLSEFSGALGDLGSFIPLISYIAAKKGIDFGAALVWGGVYNIMTVLWFDIPIAVQPMHTISSVAAAQHFSPGDLASAGLFVAGVAFFLGLTNTIELVAKYIPNAIVRVRCRLAELMPMECSSPGRHCLALMPTRPPAHPPHPCPRRLCSQCSPGDSARSGHQADRQGLHGQDPRGLQQGQNLRAHPHP
jgi:hypothetical protein